MKTFFKKMVGAAEELLGVLTVTCPELVFKTKSEGKDHFDVKSEHANTLMRVSSMDFYNYLGHWLVPDEGLKEGDFTDPFQVDQVSEDGKDQKFKTKTLKGRGLGIAPFSYNEESNVYNDLTKALDKKIYSSPGRTSTPVANTTSQNDIWPIVEVATDQFHRDTESNKRNGDRFAMSTGKKYTFRWEGDWGSHEEQYDSSANFSLTVSINNDRVPGSITGDLYPTGAKVLVWCGDENDYNTDPSEPSGSYYETPSSWDVKNPQDGLDFNKELKKFYNPFFSSGYIQGGNSARIVRTFNLDIKRPPFSNKIEFFAAIYTRGGHRYIDIVPPKPGIVNIMNLGKYLNGAIDLNVGDKIWQIVEAPFIFLNTIINQLIGTGTLYNGRADIKLNLNRRQKEYIDPVSANSYPLFMNFGVNSPRAYLFNQFYDQTFDKNPCFPYTNVMFVKKPFLLNKVVEPRFSFGSKKYSHFVPNLFRLTFETNIGVFLDQLAKQHTQHDSNKSPYNFLTKLENHNSLVDPEIHREVKDMDQHLDQLLFPTDSDKWNTYIENGWGNSKTDLSFLKNFISSATEPASTIAATMPAQYDSVFTHYPALNVNTIAEIDAIIGTHADLKSKLEADDGQDLNTWKNRCNTAISTDYAGLKSGSPKNLSYKIIEFMYWYLDDRGKAFEIRNTVSNLIRYEKELDELIDDVSGSSGPNLDNYHVVGTELFERNCNTEVFFV